MATILIRASGSGVRARASRGSAVVVMEPPENRDSRDAAPLAVPRAAPSGPRPACSRGCGSSPRSTARRGRKGRSPASRATRRSPPARRSLPLTITPLDADSRPREVPARTETGGSRRHWRGGAPVSHGPKEVPDEARSARWPCSSRHRGPDARRSPGSEGQPMQGGRAGLSQERELLRHERPRWGMRQGAGSEVRRMHDGLHPPRVYASRLQRHTRRLRRLPQLPLQPVLRQMRQRVLRYIDLLFPAPMQ